MLTTAARAGAQGMSGTGGLLLLRCVRPAVSLVEHAPLAASQHGGRRATLVQSPTEPAAVRIRAVDAQVKAHQLARTHDAGRSTAKRAISAIAQNQHLGTQLSPHPCHHLVRWHAMPTRLVHPGIQQPAKSRGVAGGILTVQQVERLRV